MQTATCTSGVDSSIILAISPLFNHWKGKTTFWVSKIRVASLNNSLLQYILEQQSFLVENQTCERQKPEMLLPNTPTSFDTQPKSLTSDSKSESDSTKGRKVLCPSNYFLCMSATRLDMMHASGHPWEWCQQSLIEWQSKARWCMVGFATIFWARWYIWFIILGQGCLEAYFWAQRAQYGTLINCQYH